MSKFLRISLATVGTFVLSFTAFAQSTIEEVIVTAQRTEQSLQSVPIAVSAFTNEALEERQIEVSSDLQLQVPGITFSVGTFSGGGGFSIRGITNFATAASADAGVEIHMNGLPLGSTSALEVGFLDMERIEVLRGPQGTLFGRNSTGGVVNLITAKPDFDSFNGTAKINYGKDNEKQFNVMLNVPISDSLAARFAFQNFEKDGITKNMYSGATGQFDDRDNYQWRASFLWEPTDSLSLTVVHEAYDEESNRNQISGGYCQTGSSLVQGCVVGGKKVFEAAHPMSNGSTLPSLLGQTVGFYLPNLENGTAPGTTFKPTGYGLVNTGENLPTDFFQANAWAAPRHDVQESTSQFILENEFDQGTLTVSYNDKKRQFYRDTASASEEATSIRFVPTLIGTGLGQPFPNGLPLGYSNSRITPDCKVEDFTAGSFCANGAGIRGYHNTPVSGDASSTTATSKTTEIKYVSDLDGMFNFLVGAIDITNQSDTFYDVYASGITLNGFALPGTIAGSYRTGYSALAACGALGIGGLNGVCDAGLVSKGERLNATGAKVHLAKYTNPAFAASAALGAYDLIARIDGTYTEFFHNATPKFELDAQAIFTEFYFDVADNHKLTVGLRYNEDRKEIGATATFYEIALASDWQDGAVADACGFQTSGAAAGTYGSVIMGANGLPTGAFNTACFDSDGKPKTKRQAIGTAPVPIIGAASNGAMPVIENMDPVNYDYTSVGYSPVKDFSATTGRIVWDWQANDDTLMFISYSRGFKGGGFNPAFSKTDFPDTPFAFDSTEVDAIEIGVKATVPEIGLVANASIYYNDFDNFHIGTIRNQTAINAMVPLENMGAELELLLAPPSVPGLTFNMAFSYFDSEIGNFQSIDPTDIGGHYRNTAESKNWHLVKNGASATNKLIKRDPMGLTYGKILEIQVETAHLTAGSTDFNNAMANLATPVALGGSGNEIAYGLVCEEDSTNTNPLAGLPGCDVGGAGIKLENSDLLNMLPFEASKASVYGETFTVCHNLAAAADYTGAAGPNTCLPVNAGGTAGQAPAATLLYSPTAITANNVGGINGNNVVIAGPDGSLLPSIALFGSGASLQTGGVCKLFNAMIAHKDSTGNAADTTVAYEGTNTCEASATTTGQFVSNGFEQDLTGNQMPFADMTLSLGIAYTAQVGNLEVTPRLDYYYRSDAYATIFNVEAVKVPAWDEFNFSLNIVPTDDDWNIRFWIQNITDDRNVTGNAYTSDSQSFINTTWVRDPRSFGMTFGIGF